MEEDGSITAAGFHGGPSDDAADNASNSGGGAGMLLTRRNPTDRRPSDCSLHTLQFGPGEGLGASSSDEESGNNSDISSESENCSDGSSHAGSMARGESGEKKGWLGGMFKRKSVGSAASGATPPVSHTTKPNDMSDSDESSYSGSGGLVSSSEFSSDDVRVQRRSSSASSTSHHLVPHHQSSGSDFPRTESCDDLVRPYQNALRPDGRPNVSPASQKKQSTLEMAMNASNSSLYKPSKKRPKWMSKKLISVVVLCVACVGATLMILDGNGAIPSSDQAGIQGRGVDIAEVGDQSKISTNLVSDSATAPDENVVADEGIFKFIADNLSEISFRPAKDTIPLEKEAKEAMEPCITNGGFEAQPDPSIAWYSVRSDISVTEMYSSPGEHALLATDRTNQRIGGMWQNVRSDCLVADAWYEVQADVLLRRSDTQETVDCDPTIPWFDNERSCPSVAIMDNKVATDIAYTVGPLTSSQGGDDSNMAGWHKIYGVFRPTREMLQNQVQVLVARAPIDVDIIVDNISINPASANSVGIPDPECKSNLIVNGNAEIGDYRNWWIRGNGGDSGYIDIIPNAGKGSFSFRHGGYRAERWRGMLQTLDTSCLVTDSEWIITASFRYFGINEQGEEVPTTCSKLNNLVKGSCPVFDLQFFSPIDKSVPVINTGPLQNEDTSDFKVGEWNQIQHTFVITPEIASQTNAWIYVNSVDEGMIYELDDVQMIPAA